jgi:hypothetical protein
MFENINASIEQWASGNKLAWNRRYRDEEVRSIELTLSDGRNAQIWLEQAPDSAWVVRAWDRGSNNFRKAEISSQVEKALSDALAAVHSWDAA